MTVNGRPFGELAWPMREVGALFLAVCGLLAFGLGAMLRHTAGAIAAGIGLCSCSGS